LNTDRDRLAHAGAECLTGFSVTCGFSRTAGQFSENEAFRELHLKGRHMFKKPVLRPLELEPSVNTQADFLLRTRVQNPKRSDWPICDHL
jgi:hypothetical protein